MLDSPPPTSVALRLLCKERQKIHLYRHYRTHHTVALDESGNFYMYGSDAAYHLASRSEAYAWLYEE